MTMTRDEIEKITKQRVADIRQLRLARGAISFEDRITLMKKRLAISQRLQELDPQLKKAFEDYRTFSREARSKRDKPVRRRDHEKGQQPENKEFRQVYGR